MGPMDIVKRAQATSLMGPYEPRDPEELLSPYESLGDTSTPYDLTHLSAAAELKQALYALGMLAADRHRTADPAIETRYQDIVLGGDVAAWEAGAADELAIAIGRYRGLGWQVPGPYAVSTPGGPQPTASGLELIAGAVNDLLGGYPRMVRYEQWREGAFAPPSRISGPDPAAPIVHLSYFGPAFQLAPPGTAPDILEQISAADRMLSDAHAAAMVADSEEKRAEHAASMLLGRALRDVWVSEAVARAHVREGTTEVVHMDEVACTKLGGRWVSETGVCETPAAARARAEPNYLPLAAVGAAVALALLAPAALLVSRAEAAPKRDYGGLSGSIVPSR